MHTHTTGANEISFSKDNNNSNSIDPAFEFDKYNISAEEIKADSEKHLHAFEPIPHKEILSRLLERINRIDFRKEAGFTDGNEKLSKKHYLVCCIEQILSIAQSNNWGICKNHDFVYLYNGVYWNLFDNNELQMFLGEAAEKMGIDAKIIGRVEASTRKELILTVAEKEIKYA